MFAGVIALFVLATFGGLMWAALRGRPEEDRESGRLVFRHSVAFRVLSCVLLFGPLLGITVLLFIVGFKKDSDLYAVLGLYALFTLLGMPLVNESMRWQLMMDDDGLTCWSPWRGKGYIAWQELKRVRWAANGSYFILESPGFWFRASPLVPGLSRLMEECEKRLPPEAMEPAYAGYGHIRRPVPGMKRSEGFDLRRWKKQRDDR